MGAPTAAVLVLALVMLQASSAALTQTAAAKAAEVLGADTPRTTVEGNTFIAPAGWRIELRGPATILSPPEGGSHIALVDVRAKDAESAVAAAWAAYKPDAKWPLKVTNDYPDKDGWSNIRDYSYQTSPNEKRGVGVTTRRAGDVWTVSIYDMEDAVGEKRGAQVALIFSRLLPKGYERETFAGKAAHTLDAARLAALSAFVETGRQKLGVPGVAVGIVQDGKVVFADGFGVRELGSSAKPDGDTLFIVASNTKALTTLMLGKLLDEGKLTWDTPVTKLLPSFKLGSDDTTSRVLVKHLICACTGLPRQDFEWLFQYEGITADGAMKTLATIQPTTKFGELFQYSNGLAAAAGFVGGHVAFPDLELGAAYAGPFRVVPAWDPPPAEPSRALVVDPGRAFGTGTHETTRLCLESLELLAARRRLGRTLDLGAGTGLLAVAASRLGASPVVATDVDPEATASSRRHALLNRAPLRVVRADGGRGFRAGAFDLVLANLMALFLVDRVAEVRSLVAPGGALVLSGLLVGDVPDVRRAYDPLCGPPAERTRGEWAALVYEVPGP